MGRDTTPEARTYYTENEYDDVKGFTILDAKDDHLHIAGKWLRSGDEEDRWLDYNIPRSQLAERLDKDLAEHRGTISQEQYEAVCRATGREEYLASPEAQPA